MRILLVGTGGVGESIAKILDERDPRGEFLQLMVLSDYNLKGTEKVYAELKHTDRVHLERLDASKFEEVVDMAQKYKIDFIMDAAPPFVTKNLFDAAYEAGCSYMNMGLWSEPHPEKPYEQGYVEWMGEYNFARHDKWEAKGLLAVLGMGIDPGVTDVFAKFCEKHLFDELDCIDVKDGNNLKVEGMNIVFGFNPWTVFDEVLNPNVTWEKNKGWYVQPPFAEPEIFDFPEGIGPQKLVKVEHEETVFMPKYINKGLKKVSFKIALGDEMINALKVINELGMDKKEKIKVGNVEVSPRDVLAAVVPQPADIGDKMTGKMCVGINVKGRKDGKQREVFMYQALDNNDSMERYGTQAVVAQTGLGAAIAIELLGRGIWKEKGVHAPEAFEPEPFLKLMEEYDYPYGLVEKDSEYKRARDKQEFERILHGA